MSLNKINKNMIDPAFVQEVENTKSQLADKATKGDIELIPKIINKGLATNTISNGGGYQRKPIVSFTFDDGYKNDISLMKPLMDQFGIKGTIYIHSEPDETIPRLTDNDIIQMHKEGWEFGSHTRNHSVLSSLNLNKNILIGDTTIEIINSIPNPLVKVHPKGTKLRVNNSDIVFTVTSQTLSNNVLTFTLKEPSKYVLQKPATLHLHEESVLDEILPPKKRLESLGIPCPGFAYPYGSTTLVAKKVIQSHFNYARLALSNNAGTNGGVLNDEDLALNQFRLNCSELVGLSEEEMDALIARIQLENSLLIVLGHTSGWAGLEPKLRIFIGKVKKANITSLPLSEALLYHGNLSELGDFVISKSGFVSSGGVNLISSNEITAKTGIIDFPIGITYVNISDAKKDFPSKAGALQTVRTKVLNSGSWSYQMFFEFDDVTLSNQIFFRKSTGSYTWSNWKRVTQVTATTSMRNSIFFYRNEGDQVYDTTLGRPAWCKSPGKQEIDTLTISSGATKTGNVAIKLNTTTYNVTVTTGMTDVQIAETIRNTAFNGWVTGGTGNVVSFTKSSMSVNAVPTFADIDSTGTNGSFAVTVAGSPVAWVDAMGATI